MTGGTLTVDNTSGSGTGSGPVTVSLAAILTGLGSMTGPVTVLGTISPGDPAGSFGLLTANSESWEGHGTLLEAVSADGTLHDQLALTTSLTIDARANSPFAIDITSAGTPTIAAAMVLVLASDGDSSIADPFFPTTFLTTTEQELSLQVSDIQPTTGYAFQLGTQADGAGYDLVLRQVSTAVPEPIGAAALAITLAPLTLSRRRMQKVCR